MPPIHAPPRQGSCRYVLGVSFFCVALPIVWLHGRHSAVPERGQFAAPVEGAASSRVLEKVRSLRQQLDTLHQNTKGKGQPDLDLDALKVVLYSEKGCRGHSFTFNARHREEYCSSCADVCKHSFDGTDTSMHSDSGSLVKSIRVRGPAVLRTHPWCIGAFQYKERNQMEHAFIEDDGCVTLKDNAAHFQIELHEGKVDRAVLESLLKDPNPPFHVYGTPDGPSSRYQHRDWMEALKMKEIHRNWTTRFPTPETERNERLKSCGHAEADEENKKGYLLVKDHVDLTNLPAEVPDPSVAEAHFERAIELAPDCITVRVNLAVTLLHRLDGSELQKGFELVAPQGHCLPDPKALLYCGVYKELMSEYDMMTKKRTNHWPAATKWYLAAFEMDNTLPVRYFGRPHKSWGTRSVPPEPRLFFDPNDATWDNDEAHEVQRRGVRNMLLYKEFAERFGGHGAVTKAEADGFLDVWYIHLKRLVPPYVIYVLRDTYRRLVRGKMLRWQGPDTRGWPENRWTHHNGPMARFLQANILPRISTLTYTKLVPTYTYFGSYCKDGGIIPHLDREQCEYTLTITIDADPLSATCPVGVSSEPNRIKKTGYTDDPYHKNRLPPPDKQVIADSYIGDGVIFRGRGSIHWRPPSRYNCSQFFFHFVREEFVGDLN
eukprot:Hpha_TRINITY_DN11822_c0_g1::TRINITY_DN11822_c0_g1_i2::g.1936::m.1936